MARITVEDCLEKVSNRFALILLASKRTKQLLTGSKLSIEDSKENKTVVNSLREIAQGTVRFKTEEDLQKEREIALKKREAELALAAEQEAIKEKEEAEALAALMKDSPSIASDSDSNDSETSDSEDDSSSEEELKSLESTEAVAPEESKEEATVDSEAGDKSGLTANQ